MGGRFAFAGGGSTWIHRITRGFPTCCRWHYRPGLRFPLICEARCGNALAIRDRPSGKNGHLDAQYPSNRPRTAFTNRSNIARKTSPNDAPTIAPGEDGAQGLKKRWSPPAVWKYGIIWSMGPVWLTPLDELIPVPPSFMPSIPQGNQVVLLAGLITGQREGLDPTRTREDKVWGGRDRRDSETVTITGRPLIVKPNRGKQQLCMRGLGTSCRGRVRLGIGPPSTKDQE